MIEHLAIVADDRTGAIDTAGVFASAGLAAHVSLSTSTRPATPTSIFFASTPVPDPSLRSRLRNASAKKQTPSYLQAARDSTRRSTRPFVAMSPPRPQPYWKPRMHPSRS